MDLFLLGKRERNILKILRSHTELPLTQICRQHVNNNLDISIKTENKIETSVNILIYHGLVIASEFSRFPRCYAITEEGKAALAEIKEEKK